MKHLNKFLENSGDKLIKVYNFKDIYKAIQFVKKACDIFNELDHHPDYFCLEGNNVTIHLSTHSVGGVTQKDWDVVTQLNNLLKN
jgi:4a-hydroxytetrahydrobiopterin dehydratase